MVKFGVYWLFILKKKYIQKTLEFLAMHTNFAVSGILFTVYS